MLGFWFPRRICVFDFCVVDTDTESHNGRHPHKIISYHKRRKKGNYIEDLFERQSHFTILVSSVNGLMGEETKVENKQLDDALSNKWEM